MVVRERDIMVGVGLQRVIKSVAKFVSSKRITIKQASHRFRVLANSTRLFGGSMKGTSSSIPSVSRAVCSSLPSEFLDDTLDYVHQNTVIGGDDIVLAVQDLEDRGRQRLSRCAGLTELDGDERRAVKQDLKEEGVWRIIELENEPNACLEFEEYRTAVMTKARNTPPSESNESNFSLFEEENRPGVGKLNESVYCRANGNELQRYYGTTVSCSLKSSSGSSSNLELCPDSTSCGLCLALKDGLGQAVTCSTAATALKKADVTLAKGQKKAVIVCRVIAGRVRPRVCSRRKIAPAPDEFDSVALDNNDLCVQHSSAVLPCYVLNYK